MSTLDNLRKGAKRWLKALRDGDLSAIERLRRAYPAAPANPTLRDVQHALAREHGFADWQALKANAEAPTATSGIEALLTAAGSGDAAAVAAILDREPGLINQRGHLPGTTGLRTALHYGVHHEPVVRELLSRGADPNIRDDGDNAYPIHFAAERGALPIVKLLIEHGADPIGAGTMHLLDVIGWAVCFNDITHLDVARYLLEHGARHTLLSAVAMGDVNAIRQTVRDGADINQRMDPTNHRQTPLHLAVMKKQPRSLDVMLELGADPNIEDAAGFTPLDHAALAGHADLSERLLAAGAEVRLASAILLERPADLERIERADPDLHFNNRLWARLLVRASSRSSGEHVDRLLRAAQRHRAGLTIVNMPDDEATAVDNARGYMPLHAAAWSGNNEATAVLLRHGANPRVRDEKYCATPAAWARYAGKTTTCDLILEGDIDIFDAIDADRADKVAAILDRDPGAIDRPFKAYATCPVRDDQWWPMPDCLPLQWAESQGKNESRRVLLERGATTRTAAEIERAEDLVRFVRLACWDHHVHGKRDHRMHNEAAQRLLASRPDIARADIHAAIVCGDLEEVRRRIEARPAAAWERGGARHWTPILTLCYTRFTHEQTHDNAVAIARLLLDHGADANDFYMAGDARYSALTGIAAEGEQDAPRQPYANELFQLLLECGAEPYDVQVLYNTHFRGDMLWWLELVYEHTINTPRDEAWRDSEWTMFDMGAYGSGARFVLETALKKRNLRLAAWALARGANPNSAPARDTRFPKTTLWQESMRQGFAEMADLLRSYGATAFPAELSDRENLVPACLRLDRSEVERLFSRHPEFMQIPDPLFAAAEQDRADVAAFVLDLGVSPDVHDAQNERALHRAAGSNALAVATILVQRGADVDARDSRYQATPLGWASYGDHVDMVALLSRFSRDFRMLCFTGCVDRVRELLAEAPNLAERVGEDGVTPLWWLSDDEPKAMGVVEALLKAGAKPLVRNKEGQTAADTARRRGLLRVADRLDKASATREAC